MFALGQLQCEAAVLQRHECGQIAPSEKVCRRGRTEFGCANMIRSGRGCCLDTREGPQFGAIGRRLGVPPGAATIVGGVWMPAKGPHLYPIYERNYI